MSLLQAARLSIVAVVISGCVHRPPMAPIVPSEPCRVSATARVRWTIPSDARDRQQLNAWCSTVGPPVVDATAAANAATDEIAVVSWNVHEGAGDVPAMVGALVRGDLTGRPVRAYVLLLQEVFRSDDDIPAALPAGAPVPAAIRPRIHNRGAQNVEAVARELGLAWAYVPSMRNGGGPLPAEDRGNAILSSVPLSDVMAIELPFERQRRVAVAASVHGLTSDRRPWRLAVASVHFDTAIAWTRGGPFAARRRQADALLEALGTFGSGPAVVGGDFNTWLGADEPAFGRLLRALPDSPRLGDEATWRFGFAFGAPLDHMFARLGGTPLRVHRPASRFGSDHYPLVASVPVPSRGHGSTS